MPLFVDDVRTDTAEVIKMLTHKEVEPDKEGNTNAFKVKQQIIGSFGDKKKIFRFTVLASDVRPDVDNPRKVIQLPNSKTFEAFYNFTDSLGNSHTLRYAESNPTKKRSGNGEYLTWSPEYIEIPSKGYIEVSGKAELAVFMSFHSLNQESGNDVQGGIKYFTTFVGSKRAADNVSRERKLWRVKELFLSPDKKISLEDMKTLANSIISAKMMNNFYALDEMGEEEIVQEMVRLCEISPDKMWSMYLGIGNQYRRKLKEFKDAGVLKFTPHDLAWTIMKMDGTNEVLGTVPIKTDTTEWIINFLIEDTRGAMKKLENLLEQKKTEGDKKKVA